MAWDFDRSKERVENERKRIDEIGMVVKKLTREMDLTNLSPTEGRLVHGVHMYTDVTNFAELLSDRLMRKDGSKRLYRYMNAVVREQRHIQQVVFNGDKVQVQGFRFHGLLYKPYDDDAALAKQALLSAITNHLLFSKVLPDVFSSYTRADMAAGLDLGDCVVANIGVAGDRELLSVGAPANYAAKILGKAGTITVGCKLWQKLAEEEQDLFIENNGSYVLEFSNIDAEGFLEENNTQWSTPASANRIQEFLDAVPLDDVAIEEARERIDTSRLGPKTAKNCPTASFFVDIDGYTAMIDGCNGDTNKLTEALKILHLFRYELRHVIFPDFDGIPIQHQGDRLQAVLQVPAGNDSKILQRAADIAISFNSSVEEILNDVLGTKLSVAIGCDFGDALIGRIGIKGDLDLICVGKSTSAAENIQLERKGNEIGISSVIQEAIKDDEVRKQFEQNHNRDHFFATNLTWITIEDAGDSAAYDTSKKAVFTSSRNILVGSAAVPLSTPLKVTRNWGE
jgi:class 3 adenylate cyclase